MRFSISQDYNNNMLLIGLLFRQEKAPDRLIRSQFLAGLPRLKVKHSYRKTAQTDQVFPAVEGQLPREIPVPRTVLHSLLSGFDWEKSGWQLSGHVYDLQVWLRHQSRWLDRLPTSLWVGSSREKRSETERGRQVDCLRWQPTRKHRGTASCASIGIAWPVHCGDKPKYE